MNVVSSLAHVVHHAISPSELRQSYRKCTGSCLSTVQGSLIQLTGVRRLVTVFSGPLSLRLGMRHCRYQMGPAGDDARLQPPAPRPGFTAAPAASNPLQHTAVAVTNLPSSSGRPSAVPATAGVAATALQRGRGSPPQLSFENHVASGTSLRST